MSVYISGIGVISPQQSSAVEGFAKELVFPDEGGSYSVIPPDYKAYIEPKLLRRMSRILKMGVAAGIQALEDAQLTKPDAVITATGLGCTGDTHRFLSEMVSREEQALSPTSFIQSTHNTIGGQIALQLGLQGYNMTYTQRDLSFSSALLDSLLMIESGGAQHALLGGVDEHIEPVEVLMRRMGLSRPMPQQRGDWLRDPKRGAVSGEGAAFFALTNSPKKAYARVVDVSTQFLLEEAEIKSWIQDFLAQHNLAGQDVDLLLSGRNGDAADEKFYDNFNRALRPRSEGVFKNMCGEYQTAASYAMAVGAQAIKHNALPGYAQYSGELPTEINTVLIYTQNRGQNHALYLLSR